jgi:hypothetical protein
VPEVTACPHSVVAETIMRTIEFGVTITDAVVDERQTTIVCTPVVRDPRCPDCGRHDALPGGPPTTDALSFTKSRHMAQLGSTDAWKRCAKTPSDSGI